MSQSPPPTADNFNPFEAPRTRIGAEVEAPAGPGNGDAELVRRQYLGHEASVRSVGSLLYLGAAFFGLVAIVALASIVIVRRNGGIPRNGIPLVLVGCGIYLALAAAQAAIAHGLRTLRPWARWVTAALMGLGLLTYLGAFAFVFASGRPLPGVMVGVVAIICLVTAYILYLLLGSSGAVVFSADYREVVRLTPHIRYKTSLFLKIFAVILIALIAIGFLMAAINRPGR